MLIGSTGHLLTGTLLRSPVQLAPWIAAGVVGLFGFLFATAERAHSPARATVAVAACSAALQLVITQAVLPEFDVFCSARPWGEQLGRAARGGAAVMTFGFTNQEVVSPFLFYAGHLIPDVHTARRLEQRLRRRPACALVRADAHEKLAAVLGDLATTPGTVGRLRFVLVSGSAGGCERRR